jgi:hypothetical protein
VPYSSSRSELVDDRMRGSRDGGQSRAGDTKMKTLDR